MKTALATPISLTDARTGKRVRVSSLPEGTALVEPILGYYRKHDHLTVYVNGSMPLDLRTAHEDGAWVREAATAYADKARARTTVAGAA